MLTFESVQKVARTLPGVVEGTAYGAPALKLNGRILACVPSNKSADANSMVVRIDPEQRAELLRQTPDVYYITDHYAPYPTVLVRLSKLRRDDLQALLRDAHRFVMSEQKRPVKLTEAKPSPRRTAPRQKPRNV